MKLAMATTFALFLCSFNAALSANPQRIENSIDDLFDEVKVAVDAGFFANDDLSHYIPDYGLEIVLEKVNGIPERDDAIRRISSAVVDYNDTVDGLGEGEWISVFFSAYNEYTLLIRIKQGQPETLEVWVNGLLEE